MQEWHDAARENRPVRQSAQRLRNQAQYWPTPRAEYDSGRHRGQPDTLHSAVKMWPTPDANMGTGGRTFAPNTVTPTGKDLRTGRKRSVPLNAAVTWPTPSANQQSAGVTGLNGGSGARAKLESLVGRDQMLLMAGGSLNPTWVEWLMGYPLGWTVCEAWATRSSRTSRNGSAAASSPLKG
jgi:hypothetical protein